MISPKAHTTTFWSGTRPYSNQFVKVAVLLSFSTFPPL
nr:MAG TPA: hypothetical protein [Microviridae sp.]